MSEARTGIIVLAAGASSRMGAPKQLLNFGGETLLRRAARAALATTCRPVVIVLGSHADALRAEIADLDAHAVINEFWQEGMSSSIRCGLRALEELAHNELEAAMLTLCDQPFVTGAVLTRLVDAYHQRRAPLVASEYKVDEESTLGVPALFTRAFFTELMALNGAEGAKRVITRHASEAVMVCVPEAIFDVDTPEDYRSLVNSK